MALRASGRLSVISATPSRTEHKSSVVPVSISMGPSPCHDIPGHRTHRQDRPPHHGLSRLRSGSGAAADLLPWLARALAVVAASAAGLRRARLPLHRARHARLRPLEHLRAPRGFRAGADRRRHAGAAGLARPRQGGLDRPRLGQPGGVEHGVPSSRQDGRAWRASACPISRRASRSSRSCRWSTARVYPEAELSRRASGTTSSSTRRASTRPARASRPISATS